MKLVTLILVLFVCMALGCEDKKGTPSVERAPVTEASGEAPNFKFRGPDGTSGRLEDVEGKIRLVHFWATWCKPCVEELPKLLEFGRETPEVTVLAVTIDPNWGVVRDFFGGEIPEWVVMPEVNVDRAFGVESLPETYVVDDEGQIVRKMAGARDWSSEETRREVLEAR